MDFQVQQKDQENTTTSFTRRHVLQVLHQGELRNTQVQKISLSSETQLLISVTLSVFSKISKFILLSYLCFFKGIKERSVSCLFQESLVGEAKFYTDLPIRFDNVPLMVQKSGSPPGRYKTLWILGYLSTLENAVLLLMEEIPFPTTWGCIKPCK